MGALMHCRPCGETLWRDAIFSGLAYGLALWCVPGIGLPLAACCLLPLLRHWQQALDSDAPLPWRRLWLASLLGMLLGQWLTLGYFLPQAPFVMPWVLTVQGLIATLPWLLLPLFRPLLGRHMLWALPALWVGCDWVESSLDWLVPTPLGVTLGAAAPLLPLYAWTGIGGGTLLLLVLQVGVVQAGLNRHGLRLGAAVAGGWLLLGGGLCLSLPPVQDDRAPRPLALVRSGPLTDDNRGELALQDRLLRLSGKAVAAGARLVVWPESALLNGLTEPGAVTETLARWMARRQVGLLAGHLDADHNGVSVRWPDGRLASYHKRWLVPAAEHPYLLGLGPGRLQPGVAASSLPVPEGGRLGPLICYEVLIGRAGVEQVRAGATALLVLANDVDFWNTPARWQLDAMARIRAVETGRDLLRVTSVGSLWHVDAWGRQVWRDDETTPAAHLVWPQWREGLTWYVRYPASLPVLALAGLVAGCLLALGRRYRQRRMLTAVTC